MTDSAMDTAFAARLGARRDRQARVGILRNPNSPPSAPARRVALTGKWMRLRSTRRPNTPADPPEGEGVVPETPPAPIVTEGEGGVRIDLDALQKTVADLSPKPQRSAYAQNFRHDLPLARPPRKPRREAAELTLDPPEPEPAPSAATPEPVAQPRRWPLALGAALCALGAGVFLLR